MACILMYQTSYSVKLRNTTPTKVLVFFCFIQFHKIAVSGAEEQYSVSKPLSLAQKERTHFTKLPSTTDNEESKLF